MDDMDWSGLELDGRGELVDVTRVPTLAPPPDFTWTPAADWPILWGESVAIAHDDGTHQHNLMAVSEITTDLAGSWVLVTSVETYAAWVTLPPDDRPPVPRPAKSVEARRVWVSHPRVEVRGG